MKRLVALLLISAASTRYLYTMDGHENARLRHRSIHLTKALIYTTASATVIEYMAYCGAKTGLYTGTELAAYAGAPYQIIACAGVAGTCCCAGGCCLAGLRIIAPTLRNAQQHLDAAYNKKNQ